MGDVFPVLGIARALKARGHHTTVVTTHNFAAQARAAASAFVPVGEPGAFERAIEGMDMQAPGRAASAGVRNLLAKVEPVFDAVAAQRPDAVVANSLSLGARLASEVLRIPMASVVSQTVMMRSTVDVPVYGWLQGRWGRSPAAARLLYGLADGVIDHVLGRPLRSVCARRGWPQKRFRREPSWFLSPDLVLLTWPAWFSPSRPDWPAQARHAGFVKFDDAAQPGDGWRRTLAALDGRPVLFTAGSWNKHARRFFEVAVQAAGQLGMPAILLTQYPGELPAALPPQVVPLSYAPFSELLPECAALVHHGGPGSAASALACGVPQLSLPQMFDQFDNTHHLLRLGVARSVADPRYAHIEAAPLAQALAALLASDTVRERCRVWQARMLDEAPFAAALDAIEGLLPGSGSAGAREREQGVGPGFEAGLRAAGRG